MKNVILTSLAVAAAMCMGLGSAQAQLAKGNSCKFLGNITTSYNWQEYCDPQGISYKYTDLWDQVTCENATKWGSVHSGWGTFNWENADRTYNYCKQKGIIFKFHALIWGSQHPGWIERLSVNDTKKAIIEWYDEVKKHYPDLSIIDVVNEAIYSGGNYHSPYKETKIIEALGSLAEDRAQQQTGVRPSYNCNTNGYPNTNSYQWIAEAFRLARDRWPNATLIYNDYNTFQWQKNEFIALINGLKACGAPIDAAGHQSHDLNDMGGSQFKNALYEIYQKTNMPVYITEYDIAKQGDNGQKTRYSEQFPIMWEADFVCGVTLWGWIHGKTWVDDSGLVKDGQDRPAMTWLKQYMATDAAKRASVKSDYICGRDAANGAAGGGAISLNISDEVIELGQTVKISAELDGCNHFNFKANGVEIKDKWVAPYEFDWTPEEAGSYVISVTGTGSDNKEKTSTATIKVVAVGPYGGTPAVVPGKIEAENYDNGFAGKAYNDLSEGNKCDDYTDFYRSDDIDIKKIDGGIALGHCQKGEWMNYTIDVAADGEYDVTLRVGTGNSDGGLMTVSVGNEVKEVTIDKTGDWGTFAEVKIGSMKLYKGEQTLRLSIDKDWIDVDWIKFEASDATGLTSMASNAVIAVVPNPASSAIEVIGVEEGALIEIIAPTGTTIKTTTSAEISLDDVENGIYMVRISTNKETVVKRLIVKK